MNAVSRLTLIGTYAPRRCGIATFTQDLRNAVLASRPGLRASVAMMAQEPCVTRTPVEVSHVVLEQERAAYRELRDAVNDSGADAVSLQHEYGVFGGPDGAWILDALRGLHMPVVTTCHTVLATPSASQRQVLMEIGRLSATLVVMGRRGHDLLRDVYGIAEDKIAIIPHGIPDTDPAGIDRAAVREALGWTGRQVLLTTGLLSPNKGLHDVIEALPRIVAAHPAALYVIAGATHPNLVRQEGEACRDALRERAERLGVADHVRFINRFAARDELVRLIVAADVFVTPYLNEAQITSGVLAYASGLGKPVISTPYWHARELLDESRGVLVPFESPEAIAEAASALLAEPARLRSMAAGARDAGRHAMWKNVGGKYLELFDEARSRSAPHAPARAASKPPTVMKLDHLHRLTGPLGIYQHAAFDEPDLEHGYCTDDNARALITAHDLLRGGLSEEELRPLKLRAFNFVREAFDDETGRFRNFRSTDDEWHDGPHSEDSHGRALWSLGHAVRHATDQGLRAEAVRLFHRALPAVRDFTSPRAWAFTLLGIASIQHVAFDHDGAAEMQCLLAGRLMELHRATADAGWRWFEDSLSYDNARLPQAMLVTGAQRADSGMIAVGEDALRWLMRWQQAPEHHFRAIGSACVFRRGDAAPAQWDQQPLEAQASVAACLEAHHLFGGRRWLALANNAFAWFEGVNDLGLPVGDAETGACHDGVQPGGLNQNRGAESTLAFLQAWADMRLHSHAAPEKTRQLALVATGIP